VRTARRVLVIEDDRETAGQLVDCLSASGYGVDVAADGDGGLRRALTANYAVLTVDRLLPYMDGLEIIRRLRAEAVATPALILSALGEVDDRVRGLRAAATTIWSSPSPHARCWRGSTPSPAAARPWSRKRCCASAIWKSICWRVSPDGAAAKSS
jgi:CheY-like chemotaxis protein